jgi:hypothetical protein
MFRPRITIARCMAAVAILGLDIGLIRAYALAEITGRHLDEVNFGVFAFFALQFGLWRYLRTAGRRRRFWLGFEVCGLAAVLFMAYVMLVDERPAHPLLDWYFDMMADLAYHWLPAAADSFLENDHPTLWGAIGLFLPELVAALLGGTLAACLFKGARAARPAPGPPGETSPSARAN